MSEEIKQVIVVEKTIRLTAEEAEKLLSSKDAEIQQHSADLKDAALAIDIRRYQKEIQQLKEAYERLHLEFLQLEVSKGATREQIEKAFMAGVQYQYEHEHCRPILAPNKSEYIESQFPQGDVNNDKK